MKFNYITWIFFFLYSIEVIGASILIIYFKSDPFIASIIGETTLILMVGQILIGIILLCSYYDSCDR